MSILNQLSSLTTEQLTDFLEKTDEALQKGAIAAIHEEIRQRCAREGLYWLKFVKTRDEADPENTVKSFPLFLEYVVEIWRTLDESNRVIVAKSRQMMMSWIACAFCVWWARFKPNQAVFFQSQKDDDANAMVALPGMALGRCQFIEVNLPDFLRLPCKFSEGKVVYPNGSFIQALAGGADQIRGRVFSLLVEDEFAYQEEQRGVYTAVAPLIQKGARILIISTPNGTDNEYARLWFGEDMSTRRE